MTAATGTTRTAGIVLVGAYPWNHSTFDSLMTRALLPIAHRPLISYALTWLGDAGIRDVAVRGNRATRSLHRALARHVPDGMSCSYSEDPIPRGAAGSLRDAAFDADADTFVVAEGTAIPRVSLRDLLSSHRASGAVATVVVHSELGTEDYPGMRVPTGVYVFDRRALDLVPSTGFFDIKESLIPELYRAGHRVSAYAAHGASARVLSPETYLAVNGWMVERLVSAQETPAGYTRSGKCLFHDDATIASGAMLIGPVLIGPGVKVHSGATIVGPTSVGRDAVIKRGVMVSRSAIWRRAILDPHAMADRTIVADETVVEARTRAYCRVMTAHRRPLQGASRQWERHPQAEGVGFWRWLGRLIDADLSQSTAPQ